MATYPTPYGPIFYDTSSKDDYANIVVSNPMFKKRHAAATLQLPALKALRAAEEKLGNLIAVRNGWNPKKVKARAITLTGSKRSFEFQLMLWREDPQRFASPYTSGHVKGIAIDVSTNHPEYELACHALYVVGWRQARPGDETWHFSMGVTV